MARVKGIVKGDGGPGEGYVAKKNTNEQPGAWVVKFDQPFLEVPVLLATLANAEANYSFRTRPHKTHFELEIYADTGSNYRPANGSFCFCAWGEV